MSKLPKVVLKFIELTPGRLSLIRPTKVLDIRENNTGGFHEDGLFSTTTYGRVGTVERDRTFSYIPTNTKVYHPLYYKELIKLKQLYGAILSSQKYAIFDEEEKDFVESDAIRGYTGYSFFVNNFPKLEFKRNKSAKRDARIDFLNKYRPTCFYENILVLPAGLRDIKEKPGERATEGEINEFYRRILGASNSLASQKNDTSSITDTSRVSIQNGFNQVYLYLNNMIKDKSGFIASKWAKRAVATGSRSVLTSISTATKELGSPGSFSFNDTAVGLLQACKSHEPLMVHEMLKFTSDIFQQNATKLVDKNTLQSVKANLASDVIDRWVTSVGVSKTLNQFATVDFRTRPIEIGNDYYLALVYKGVVKGRKVYKILKDIRDLPEGFSRGDVSPLTYVELIYLLRLNEWNRDLYFVSRYPITGDGSIYPSVCHIRTTVNTDERWGLDDEWNIDETLHAQAYPILENAKFIDSMSVHPARLGGLGGDHDGDKMSAISILTQSARQEIYEYLNTPQAYINGDKEMLASAYVDSVQRVLANITGD